MFSKFRSSLKNKEKEMLETFPKQRKEKTHLYYHPFQSIEAASKKIKGNIRNVPKTKGIKKTPLPSISKSRSHSPCSFRSPRGRSSCPKEINKK